MADLRRPATMLFCLAELKSTLMQSGERIFSEIVWSEFGDQFRGYFYGKENPNLQVLI